MLQLLARHLRYHYIPMQLLRLQPNHLSHFWTTITWFRILKLFRQSLFNSLHTQTLASCCHDCTTLLTQMKLKANIICEETKKLLIYKGDVILCLKAPDLSYVTRASAFVLVYIWFVRQRQKAARVVWGEERKRKNHTHISRSEKRIRNRISELPATPCNRELLSEQE
jgi:hypothetical protein